MTNFDGMTDERFTYVEGVIRDIKKVGPTALLAQYCNWANLLIQTIHDNGRGAVKMRAEQILPLVIILQGMTNCPDTERLVILLKDSMVRALFNSKLYSHETLELEDAEEGIKWILDETHQYRETP